MGTDTQREDKAAREDKALRQLTDRLVADYTDTHPEQDVRTAVGAARSRFDGHNVRDFIPILVERIARRSLEGQSQENAGEPEDAQQTSPAPGAKGNAIADRLHRCRPTGDVRARSR